jgi:hypothetical protein
MITPARDGIELEWSAMVEDEVLIIARRSCSERSLLSDADRIDLCRMSTNLTDTVPGICRNAMPIALLTIAYSNDPLAVSVPSYIVDSARNYRVFSLCQARSIR